jgi:hypothetical protein
MMRRIIAASAVLGVVVTCVAAMYAATPKRKPLIVEFTSHSGVMAGRLVRYECSGEAGVEDCLRSAGDELCGTAQFEIVESVPLRYDPKGRPMMGYRCVVPAVL